MRAARLSAVFVLFLIPAELDAAEIDWSVVNPFRFYRNERSFERHRAVYERLKAQAGGVAPADIVVRMERALNAPGCDDPSSYEKCFASRTAAYREARLGWAARSLGETETCYQSGGGFAYSKTCIRETGKGRRAEDYIAPKHHAARVRLAEPERSQRKGASCRWSWRSSAPGEAPGGVTAACEDAVVIDKVPYPTGLSVTVAAADGLELARANVVVRDLLVVGMGDSFASGEGNPDRPATFHPTRSIEYDGQDGLYPLRETRPQVYGVQLAPGEGERAAWRPFRRADAGWTSRDCHRSQYSYQFRTALQLALEDRHRAVTLVHLACTGAEATSGVFGEKPAREPDVGGATTVRAQLAQLLDLICVTRKGGKTVKYTLPAPYRWGRDALVPKDFYVTGCAGGKRKRDVDLIMLSLGGNDIGFSSLVGYSIIDSTYDIAPIAKVIEIFTGERMTFAPVESYLSMLAPRLQAVKAAFVDQIGVRPQQVVQTGYESMQVDAQGKLCGLDPSTATLGMGVHDALRFSPERLKAVDAFSKRFFERLRCVAKREGGCPEGLASGEGTGFSFVTEHQPQFEGRGICAARPGERADFVVPRLDGPRGFKPYNPSRYLPYLHRNRLFVSSDDAFMTANTHDVRPNCRFGDLRCQWPTDETQLFMAAMYSGAFHRTAEAHAIVADAVLNSVVRASPFIAGR